MVDLDYWIGVEYWIIGLLDYWIFGYSDYWIYWSIGVLDYWRVLDWMIGVLVYWIIGLFGPWVSVPPLVLAFSRMWMLIAGLCWLSLESVWSGGVAETF